MISTPIKIKADVERVLGGDFARSLLKIRTAHMKRLPSTIYFTESKPSFALSDGDVLHAYGVNLKTGEITGERYCGSGDSVMLHPEQHSEGGEAPSGFALVFVHCYWNGKNMSWAATVVSKDMVRQIGTK